MHASKLQAVKFIFGRNMNFATTTCLMTLFIIRLTIIIIHIDIADTHIIGIRQPIIHIGSIEMPSASITSGLDVFLNDGKN